MQVGCACAAVGFARGGATRPGLTVAIAGGTLVAPNAMLNKSRREPLFPNWRN